MNSFIPINAMLNEIKSDLDFKKPKSPPKKVSMLYAHNATGKTRISKLFYDEYNEQVLYYNAFTEDLFSWDNDDVDGYIFKIRKDKWIFKIIEEQVLYDRIVKKFQTLTRSKIVPFFDIPNGKITFRIYKNYIDFETIKISRGEESIFIWSIFYTILNAVISILDEDPYNDDFDSIQYIIIDDPVSSIDDTRIITIALELAELIKSSNNQLKFLITTHHALFFNVLFNVKNKNWDRKNYILSQSGEKMQLKNQGQDSPFAYHHVIINEIIEAIKNEKIERYHFNLFRALLEKTANFLGYSDGWSQLLQSEYHKKEFVKFLNHYSHSKLSDIEPRDIPEHYKEDFKEVFKSFIQDYKWGIKYNE